VAGKQALLIMDVQHFIVENYLPAGSDLLDRLRQARDAARAADVPVVYVRGAFRPGHPEASTRNPVVAQVARAGLLTEAGKETRFHPALEVSDRDIVVTKRRVDPFVGTDLEILLRSQEVEVVALAGLITSGTVLTSFLTAHSLDLEPIVLSDGCADPDTELHEVLITRLFPKQGTVMTVADWSRTLSADE
jgi:nicotinamidase-related amidase